jgi:HK97 gp10 family phage protein
MAKSNLFNASLEGDLDLDLSRFENTIREQVSMSGVAAMANVLYVEARYRAPVSEAAHWFYGTHQKYLFTPGTLRDSIYRVFSKSRSSDEVKTYQISWNHQKAPYGFMVEFGTSNAPAHPFVRPAYDAKIELAITVGKDRMAQKLEELTR